MVAAPQRAAAGTRVALDATLKTFLDQVGARVVLVEAGPRLLPAFPAPLGERARRDLEALGVDVRLDALVGDVAPGGVVLHARSSGGRAERSAAATVLWGAGTRVSPLGVSICEQAGLAPDRGGRVPVAPDLSLPGHPELFVVGDLARVEWSARGATVPAVAPAAIQMGRRAGENVTRRAAGAPARPFVCVDKGERATIGKHRAVASFFGGRLRVAGWAAWWFWLALHLVYPIGFRNRLSVLLQWGYAYLFGDRGARLILGGAAPAASPETSAPERGRAERRSAA